VNGQQRIRRKQGAVRIKSVQTAPLLVEYVDKMFGNPIR